MSRLHLSLGVWSLFITSNQLGAVPEKIISPREFPGRGVEPIAFVPSVAGGIEAIDALRGKVLWSTTRANKPLLVNGDTFFAQAQVVDEPNQVRIVGFDIPEGKKTFMSDPIIFPEWVSVPIAHGRSFRSTARLQGEKMLLIWKAEGFYEGGAEPTEEQAKAARKSAQGAMRIDLATKKVAVVDDYKVTEKEVQADAVELREMGIANMIIKIEDRGMPAKMRRFIKANESQGTGSWEREIAAPVYLPLRK